MTQPELVIRARRMITPAGEHPGAVGIADGVIVAVGTELDGPAFVDLADDEVLLPGLVDTHVHVNDPGRTEWEGFATATRAAAAGGVTTIVDMPLNSVPPTTDVAALGVKRTTAFGQTHVDVGFWGGAVPGNLEQLPALHEAGVFGFKCFLLHSGVDEFGHLSTGELAAVMAVLARVDALLIVHAEDPDLIEHAPGPHGRAYRDFLASRPKEAEHRAIATLIDLARRTGARVHVLHLSSADALPMLAAARRDGVAITVETCPHYLTLSAEEIADGATQFKCCPPIRDSANQDALWQGLADRVIDCVVSDHSPCTADLKRFDTGDFGEAWGGIAGLQLGLPAMWTAARRRGVPLTELVRWMSWAPAELAGLTGKGAIEVGRDADLCVFAPDGEFTVDAEELFHRNAVSAYHGRTLTGVVRRTWLRGREVTGAAPHGKLLER
ncbi:allantoinase AllB [Actinophytocola algeriensis]|uniref:allantoinase n=1 Tax=Actinophytocola algeriensis TaxID=1768010 RepID=A0A7W7QBN5_9PSEU|nr:allantoinase AllB [Actinophytocola algeriensis]MBB4910629.1 allantoinase [Actinophytocola algeriensis]MBE1480383.1 allantoinase [Actinophytocola algeriensis]